MNSNKSNTYEGSKEIQIRDESKAINFNVLMQYQQMNHQLQLHLVHIQLIREEFHAQLSKEILAYLDEKLS